MFPGKCGGVSLSFTVLYRPKTFLSEIQLNCSLVTQLVCAEGLALLHALKPCLQAPWRPGVAQWLTCDLLQQFSIGRTHGHQRLSNSSWVTWQVSSKHSSQEASPHNSLQQWVREVQDLHFITQPLPVCGEFGTGRQQQIQPAGERGIWMALWPGFADLSLRNSRSDPTTSGFN